MLSLAAVLLLSDDSEVPAASAAGGNTIASAEGSKSSDQDEVDDEEENEESTDASESRKNGSEPTDRAENGELSTAEILQRVASSGSATVSLCYDPSTETSLPQKNLDLLIPALTGGSLKELEDYAYLFMPEYHIVLDGGVGYGVLQEVANDRAILKFDESEVLYEAEYAVFSNSNEIQTEEANDLANLLVFLDDSDETAAINTLARDGVLGNYVWNAVCARQEGYGLQLFVPEGGLKDVFQIDSLDIVSLAETDPGLSCAVLSYRVQPLEMPGTLPDTAGLWEEDGWLCGNRMVVLFWTDTTPAVPRTYMLGMQSLDGGQSEIDAALAMSEYPGMVIEAAVNP